MTALTAQKQAADPGASCWVAASAGTGKTKVLIDRLARLLLLGFQAESILCITFTKAAATEMQQRLLQKLQSWAVFEPDALKEDLSSLLGHPPDASVIQRAQHLFFQTLDAPGGLKIQTIHSFCQGLLQRFPLEAGIDPCFQLIEETTANELLGRAQQHVLENPSPNLQSALNYLTGELSENRFEEMLESLQGQRAQFHEFLNQHPSLEAYQQVLEQSFLNEPAPPAPVDWDLLCATMMDHGTDADQKMAARLHQPHDNTIFLTQEGQVRQKLASKQFERSFPDLFETLCQFAKSVYQVDQYAKTQHTIEITLAFCQVAQAIFEAYQADKHRQGLLDFEDLIALTLRLLQKPGISDWVFYKLDGGFDHILVDEAQDTSPTQWQILQQLILALLTPDVLQRTLFVVGDIKQSIYSFQGAKPSIFNKLRPEFKAYLTSQERRWHDISLDVSFRTTPAVLAIIDEIFKKNPDGVQFLKEEIRHVSHRRDAPGLVELWPLIQVDDDVEETIWPLPLDQRPMISGGAQLADQIATKIDTLLKSQIILPSTQKPVQPEDILILSRRRGPWIPLLLQQLKKRHIPVAGVDRLRLKDHIAVLDLLALGRFLCLPQDDYSLACVLKSPLINNGYGLSEDQLFIWCHTRDGSLWQSLLNHQGDDPAYQQAVSFLKKHLGRVDFDDPFVLFHDILRETEGAFTARLGPECQEILSEFLQQALDYQHSHAASVQDFIDFMDAQETDIKRSISSEANQVRLMTIHGAKGLQAPVVILADSGDHPTLQKDLFIWDEDEVPLFLVKPTQKQQSEIIAHLKSKSLDQAMQEQRRLLYVAMTRSQDQLYIAGMAKKAKAGEWYDLLNEVLEDVGQKTSEDGWIFQPTPFQKAMALFPSQGKIEAPAWFREQPDQALWLNKTKESPKEMASDQQTRGILMHRLLEVGTPTTDITDWCQRHDPMGLITPQDQENLLKILTHPDYHLFFGPQSVAEVDVKSGSFMGRIDRLVVTDTTVFILDYKTGAISSTMPPAYKQQLGDYANAMQKLYPHHAVRTFLLWTDGPELVEIL
ncbi:double-strand break repair helicase AddA [Candidatus Finniella inopinata]|uniref:double-strand break repair helicase AddA n=1 Tax=Candidatus Finniella inopinata TaxID=1696036 RepID=UPI0013EEAE58|nr:double-strand break repair helicase AddA [Candidatus Finniella inopinata]